MELLLDLLMVVLDASIIPSRLCFPLNNGTPNYEAVYMFGYKAIHELGAIGKQFTKNFFAMNSTKLYLYYQGCSEGGREGWSQVQRYADSFDGAVIGAPAMRYGFLQTSHLIPDVIEKTVGYYPSSCEFDLIVNETIAACDPLDGKTDGVVSRTDLCKLHFNVTSLVGKTYYCAASTNGGMGGPPSKKSKRGKKWKKGKRQYVGTATIIPAQNGTVTAQAAEVIQLIWDGLKDSYGKQLYFSHQPSSTFDDTATEHNATSGKWELSINTMGSGWVTRFIELRNGSDFTSLDGVTYDTLKTWIIKGWQMYQDSLETPWPDLTPFNQAGGKILHYHGESDSSIAAASSVRFHESVRKIMYPKLSVNASTTALSSWYQFYLVPGAAHCGPSTTQPNGPFPQTNLAVMIDWVEKGIQPVTLNATVLAGNNLGKNEQICAWPLRPFWSGNGTSMECLYQQASIDSWLYTLDGVPMPVY